jgi:hypothetical protein
MWQRSQDLWSAERWPVLEQHLTKPE